MSTSVKDISSRLSHSTNQHVSDAFSNSSSLINTSSHNLEQSVATSRALSDMKSNSAGVNSDFTTDWANNLRAQGIDPKAMSTEQQHASANAYVSEYLHKNYGIKDHLATPSASHHNAAMPSAPNTQGLDLPSDGSTTAIDMNKATARVHEGVNNFNEKPGDLIGGQVVEQGTTGVKVIKNAASNALDIVKKATD